MKFNSLKRKTVFFLTVTMLSCLLSGCQYSSLDEYLELLGIKDPYATETAQQLPETGIYTGTLENDNSGAGIDLDFEDESLSEKSASDIIPEYSAPSESITDASNAGISFDEQMPLDETFSDSYKKLTENELNDEMKEGREAAGLTDENLEAQKKLQEGKYAYERLTASGKNLYVEILSILQNMADNVMVSTTSNDAIDLVFNYVLMDHPELFYVDGYKYTNYTVDNVITRIGFGGNYTCTPEEAAARQKEINYAVSECLAMAPSSTDDYYIIKYIYEYLIQNTEYDVNAPDNQNICSVFIGRRSVCNGYAKAAQYLFEKLGINCIFVTGTVNTKSASEVRHAWNIVQCNGAFYHFDATWGDASYQVGNGENADSTRLPTVNYDYLNVTTDEILKNHTISDEIDFPGCGAMQDNYYVREDEYFTTAEMALVAELFDRRYRDGSSNVTIKCADKDIYDQLFDKLITQRGVFDCLQGDNATVSYTTFADTNTIMFWL